MKQSKTIQNIGDGIIKFARVNKIFPLLPLILAKQIRQKISKNEITCSDEGKFTDKYCLMQRESDGTWHTVADGEFDANQD